MSLALFRCEYDGKLLRREEALNGKHLGHTVKPATNGNFFEWCLVKYWKATGLV